MIIKFDQSPEEYFRLSQIAMEKGELDRALLYGEKAHRGKGTTEYKLSLAEIFLSMGRYVEAMDMALEALCYGRGLRAELYDLMSRATSETGNFYESLHYIARKAHAEGDEDALDAMDEMVRELVSEEGSEKDRFFLVGKKKQPSPGLLMGATLALHRGEYEEAVRLASEIGEGDDLAAEAKVTALKAIVKMGDAERAASLAEEILRGDPKNAYALYVLIDVCGKKEYLPMLAGVDGDRQELYYAITAAAYMEEYEIAEGLAEKLLTENPYTAEAFFVAAAVALNAGKRARSVDLLKRLFALYSKYPAQVILKGWSRLKKCDVTFPGGMPDAVLDILRRFVRKGARDSEMFVSSMLTDESFRAAVLLLLEEGDREGVENVLRFLAAERSRQVDAYFSRVLIRTEIDPLIKRAILAELLLRKEKGKLFFVQSAVPVSISCVRPPRYDRYPQSLQEGYADAYSFLASMTDVPCGELLPVLAERAYEVGGAEKVRSEIVTAGFLYRLLLDDVIPTGGGMASEEAACRYIMSRVFGVDRLNMSKVRKFVAAMSR